MKVLFLDIDGVLNCQRTFVDQKSGWPIDAYMVAMLHRIIEATKCEVVLSSSWRYHAEGIKKVEELAMVKLLDKTPTLEGLTSRGTEIKFWLAQHPEVTRYAILDDNTDMLREQLPNFFLCPWDTGLDDVIASHVIEHLNS